MESDKVNSNFHNSDAELSFIKFYYQNDYPDLIYRCAFRPQKIETIHISRDFR